MFIGGIWPNWPLIINHFIPKKVCRLVNEIPEFSSVLNTTYESYWLIFFLSHYWFIYFLVYERRQRNPKLFLNYFAFTKEDSLILSSISSEGRFGNGVSSFFVFLKLLFFLNMATFILEFGFVTLPSIIIEPSTTSNSCTFTTAETQQRNTSSAAVAAGYEVADFISGKVSFSGRHQWTF